MQAAWSRHLGLVREFPRDLGFTWPRAGQSFARYTVHNLQEFLSTIEGNITSHSCFMQVYSHRQAREGLVDKVFFDIDLEGASLEETWEAWQNFLDHLDNLEYERRSLFSAGQGFHVFVDCWPVEVNWRSLRDFQLEQAKVSGVELDTSVMGDKNRLCRLPLTPNVKSVKDGQFRWCVPVEEDWSLDRILDVSMRKARPPEQVVVPCERLQKDLEALPSHHPQDTSHDAAAPSEPSESQETRAVLRADCVAILDYVEHINVDRIDDGRHRILHYLLVPALVKIGATNREILQRCRAFVERTGKHWAEYRNYVKDSILRTRNQIWWPWSLETFAQRYPDVIDPDRVS